MGKMTVKLNEFHILECFCGNGTDERDLETHIF